MYGEIRNLNAQYMSPHLAMFVYNE